MILQNSVNVKKYVFFTLNLKTLAVKYSYDLFQFYLYFRV